METGEYFTILMADRLSGDSKMFYDGKHIYLDELGNLRPEIADLIRRMYLHGAVSRDTGVRMSRVVKETTFNSYIVFTVLYSGIFVDGFRSDRKSNGEHVSFLNMEHPVVKREVEKLDEKYGKYGRKNGRILQFSDSRQADRREDR